MNESQVFTNALKLATPAERAAYLDEACAGNAALRAAVEALLQAHASDPGFLEQPAGSLGGTVDVPSVADAPDAPPVDSDSAEQPGVVLAGRYKLLEAIGDGGMGTVWMARQTEPIKRLVAVKLIKADMGSKGVLARFEAERQALALMDHPNIAKVHDAGTTPAGRPFFVMELVKGVPITRFCDERHLTLRERLELFVPVCQAVQHAHQKGIIHRDLKPSNILAALYDDRPVPKVIDFGVAKATGQQLTEQTLHTGFGTVVGTVEYMSPEQASFNQLDVDTRSDVYSLGVLLYELLTGSPPFSRKELEKVGLLEVLRVIREQEPSKPSTKLSTAEGLPGLAASRGTAPKRLTALVRGELDWIVMKALEKDRSRRYETANGFAMDVQRYLADEAVAACPPSAGYRLRKVLRRHKKLLAPAAAFVVVLVLGTVLSLWQAARATRSEATARDERDAADSARQDAQTADAENRRTLARQYVANGARLLEQGNRTDALLWFVEALRKDAADDDRASMHRRRIAAVAQLCPRPEQLWFHPGPVSQASFSPDGRRVLTVSGADARLWDVASGQPAFPALKHPAEVRHVAFSADGLRLLTFCGESATIPSLIAGEARVWDTATGQALMPALRHDYLPADQVHPETLPLFSPDDRSVLTLTGLRQESYLDPRPGVPGTGVPMSRWKGGEARLWESGTGKPTSPPLSLEEGVQEAHFSPDGSRVYTGNRYGQARLWDAATGQAVSAVLTGDSDKKYLRAHSFTADGKQLFITFTGSYDNEHIIARGWDATTGQPLGEPHGLAFPPYSRRPNPIVMTGRRVLVAPSNLNAQVFDAFTGRPIGQPLTLDKGLDYTYTKVSFTADGKRVLIAYMPANRVGDRSRGEARLWDAATGQALTPPMMLHSTVEHHAFSANGQRLLLVEGLNTVRVWDAATGRPLTPPIRQEGQAIKAVFSPDGRRLLTAAGSEARVWDATSGRPLTPLLKHNGRVASASFSPEGAHILTASQDGTARLWPVTVGEPPTRRLDHDGPVAHAVFSLDGRTVYTDTEAAPDVRAENGKGWLWDAGTGQALSPPINIAHTRASQPPPAPFSPDSRLLASLYGTDLQLLDARTGRPDGQSMKIDNGYRLAFSPDSRELLTLQRCSARDESGEHEATIWDLATRQARLPSMKTSGKMLKQGPLRPVFSPDGSRLVLAPENSGPNRYGQLWDPRTGLPAAPPFELAPGVSLAFSPDSQRLLLTTPAHATQVLDAKTGKALGASVPDERSAQLVRFGGSLRGFSPDGLQGYTLHGPEVQVVDLTTGRHLAPLRHPAEVNAAGFTPEGRALLTINGAAVVESHGIWYVGERGTWVFVATYRTRGELRMWDARTDEPLIPPLMYLIRDGFPFSRVPEISRDGRRLLFSDDPNTVEVWDLPDADSRGEEELVRLAQALSGRRFDVTGGLVPLETDSWALVRAGVSETVPVQPFDVVSWHRREAARCVEAKDWSAAVPHLDRLLAARPEWRAYYSRGRCRSALGDYQASVADNTRAIELGADDFRCWHNRGLAHWRLGHAKEAAADYEKTMTFPDYEQLYAWYTVIRARAQLGDAAGYRQACTNLLARWGDRLDPNDAAWLLVLAPDALADPGQIVQLAEKAYKQSPTFLVRNTLGAALYRAGQWEQAVQTLEQNKGAAMGFDWLFLAMAHHRLSHGDKAREYLGLASAWSERGQRENTPLSMAGESLNFDQRLEFQVLRREAEELLKGPIP